MPINLTCTCIVLILTLMLIGFSVSITDALIPQWSGFEWYSITYNTIFLILFAIIGEYNHSKIKHERIT